MAENHKELHERALHIAGEYLRREAELISILQDLDRARTHLHYQMPSLFAYATKLLKLSDSVALTLISIARKSAQVPELKTAIEEKKITITNARRIVPVLNAANKSEWLEKAATLTQVKLEQELAKSFPQQAAPARVRYKNESLGRLEIDLSLSTLEQLKRVQEILSQKKKAHVDAATALDAALDEFIAKHDPLEKAKRAIERKAAQKKDSTDERVPEMDGQQAESENTSQKTRVEPVARPVVITNPTSVISAKRIRFDAATKHGLTTRDGAQCAHMEPDGTRCTARHWLHIHHIKEVARGGTNNLNNLKTLCFAHHKIIHRQLVARPRRSFVVS